ncbi:TPA: helix-turn-helix transcriptional regulator [Stenotrophomonas maltophilia]|nr:helix-turn-helix transcriptional regulator [Stenotrophomonas maltophilia]
MPSDSKLVQKAFGCALREARALASVSQQELALSSGLDRTYISLLERGLRQPTLSTIFAVSGVLGIPPSVMVEEAHRRVQAFAGSEGS